VLEAQDIHTYYDSSYILRGVSLQVKTGEIVALLGRNGAGKTTTLKSIMGILVPRKGSLIYKGQEIKGLRPFQIARKGIGYVPEDRRIYPDFTVRENLEVVSRHLRRETRWKSSEEIFTLFPELREIEARLGYQLSGGESQMLTIARTLLTNPEVLLLDEPSEGLAPLVVARLLDAIKVLKTQGLGILLSEQNSRFAAKVADRVYILDEGKILFEGTCREFVQSEEVAQKYLLV
jgi:branched-chain amino acid transport system ATP-binding protein